MDVHDVGDYKVGDEWRVLEPGMVMTVEPGIYIPAGSRGVPKKFWNYRHPDRGRRGGAARWLRGPDGRRREVAGRHRSDHGRLKRWAPEWRLTWTRSMSPSSAADWSARAWQWRCAARGLKVALIEAHRAGLRRRSPVSMSAPRRWAMPAGASSNPWACGSSCRPRRRPSRASMSRTPGISDSRAWMQPELGQAALGYVVPNRVIGRALWAALQSAPDITLHMPARLESLEVASRRGCGRLVASRRGRPARVPATPVWWSRRMARSRWSAQAAGLAATVDDYRPGRDRGQPAHGHGQ